MDVSFCRSRDSAPHRPWPARPLEHPVDSSPYRIRFLGGNLRCWCADTSHPTGPKISDEGRVLLPEVETGEKMARGGSWTANARGCRSARRTWQAPQDCLPDLGIRLVRTISGAG